MPLQSSDLEVLDHARGLGEQLLDVIVLGRFGWNARSLGHIAMRARWSMEVQSEGAVGFLREFISYRTLAERRVVQQS